MCTLARLELLGKHYRAIDLERETSVSPAEHDSAHDNFTQCAEGTAEGIVGGRDTEGKAHCRVC